jgi:hypothetical protein
MTDLAATQRRLWRLLTAPEGVRAALAEAGDPQGESLRSLVRGDERRSAALRLEVYANAYFQRIHDALAADHGALLSALGAAGMNDLVTAYLLAHPPSHPSLRHAGARLAEFLAGDPVAEPFRRRWPFAADLARLEWALTLAFDAPDLLLLEREDLAAVAPADWAGLRLGLQPSVQLLELAWPVQRMREAFTAAGAAAVVAPTTPLPTRLRVWRRAERVFHRTVEPLEMELLERLRGGATFGALCERLAETVGEAEAPARAAGLLASWVGDGLLAPLS